MTYKTNFEPYVSENCSFDMERERTSEEVLYPLLTLYPHVAALQMQSNPTAFANSDFFSCYQNVGYWADAYPTQSPAEESKASSCRSSVKDSTKGRFVSKVRRLLGREADAQRRGDLPN